MNVIKLDEEAIYHVARGIGVPEVRAAYLQQVCGDDPALRDRLEALLRVCEQEASFLEFSPRDATVDAPDPIERPGTQIGPYKLMEQIGEGGMGVVYVAEQSHPVHRKVALKVIKPGMDSKQVIARFEAERQALAMMDHPNIAKIFDGGVTESGRPYFVMELVRGIPITEYCDGERLSIRERLELFVHVCRALQHAHQKGIIHRDLKPSNILVTLHDGVPVPKVIDFGVAKATGQSLTEKTVYTAFTQLVGTPLYMSPEQVELSGLDIDTRSDIYSLGVLLYELLTGTTPFDSESLSRAAFDEMRRIIREDEPPTPSMRLSTLGATLTTTSVKRSSDPRRLNRSVRGELDWIAMKALEKDRKRRYETANDFASDVMRYLTDRPVEACPPSARYRFRKFARRNKAALTTAALVVAALLVGAVVSTWQAIRATRAVTLASKREREAQSAAAESKAVAAESKAVFTFLVHDMLGASAPDQALGRDVKVAEVLAKAEKKIDTAFPKQPLVEAGVRYALGATRHALGQYDLALRHVARSYELRRDLLGPEHPETLASMDILATTLTSQGKDDEARKVNEQALEIRRRIMGPEHPDTLRSMRQLALVLAGRGKLDEGRKLCEQTLEIRRRILGPEHPDTLISMSDMALRFWLRQGKLDEARKLQEQTLEIMRRVLGPAHPDTINEMYALASVLTAQGNLDEARKLHEQSLEIRRRVLGPEHPDTLWSMQNLANVLREQGKLDEARKLDEQTLEIRRRTLGPDHPDTVKSMRQVAYSLYKQGKMDEARKLYEQTLEIRRRTLGPEHPDTLASMRQVADMLNKLDKLDEVIALYKQTLEVVQPTAANKNMIAGVSIDFAEFLATLPDAAPRDFPRAIELAQKAVALVPENATYWDKLGMVYYRAGDRKGSIAAREKASALLMEQAQKAVALGPDNAMNWKTLGLAYPRAGRWTECIGALEKALALLEPGDEDSSLQGLQTEQAKTKERTKDLNSIAVACNNLAWYLATVPDLQLRNIPRAIELAQRAVNLKHDRASDWNTLGVAYYRAGKWKEAIAALEKSLAFKAGTEGFDWIFLAMAHQQLGENDKARAWYDKAVDWIETNQPQDDELQRFRAEAAELLKEKSGGTDRK